MARTQTYTVKKGESYASIAGSIYGDQRWFSALAGANQDRMLHEGMVIQLPTFDEGITPRITQERMETLATAPQFTPREGDIAKVMEFGAEAGFGVGGGVFGAQPQGPGLEPVDIMETPFGDVPLAVRELQITDPIYGLGQGPALDLGFTQVPGQPLVPLSPEALSFQRRQQAAREQQQRTIATQGLMETIRPPTPTAAGSIFEGFPLAASQQEIAGMTLQERADAIQEGLAPADEREVIPPFHVRAGQAQFAALRGEDEREPAGTFEQRAAALGIEQLPRPEDSVNIIALNEARDFTQRLAEYIEGGGVDPTILPPHLSEFAVNMYMQNVSEQDMRDLLYTRGTVPGTWVRQDSLSLAPAYGSVGYSPATSTRGWYSNYTGRGLPSSSSGVSYSRPPNGFGLVNWRIGFG